MKHDWLFHFTFTRSDNRLAKSWLRNLETDPEKADRLLKQPSQVVKNPHYAQNPSMSEIACKCQLTLAPGLSDAGETSSQRSAWPRLQRVNAIQSAWKSGRSEGHFTRPLR